MITGRWIVDNKIFGVPIVELIMFAIVIIRHIPLEQIYEHAFAVGVHRIDQAGMVASVRMRNQVDHHSLLCGGSDCPIWS